MPKGIMIINGKVFDYEHCANYASDCRPCDGTCAEDCPMAQPTVYNDVD